MNSFSQRKQRGITQKLFLIETLTKKDEISREYVIMGSTGNVYNVTISFDPVCTCPDYTTRANRCKHIFFVLVRIMKVYDPDKMRYTSNDLKNMFNNIPEITNILCVDNDIKDKYIQSKNNKITIKNDDLCPICLDDIQNGEEFEYCQAQCGKCVHKLCFTMWCKKNPANCLVCKTPWGIQKYINLGNTLS